jgi:3-carboxy-cis,cis-muconate cycloisomerase
MAEAVMLTLGEEIGRQYAHDAVYESAQAAATTGQKFSRLLAKTPQVSGHLDQARIDALLDPASYTGRCADMARTAAVRARAAAGAALGRTGERPIRSAAVQ